MNETNIGEFLVKFLIIFLGVLAALLAVVPIENALMGGAPASP